MQDKKLLIIGAGQHGSVVKEIAEEIGCYGQIDFLDDHNCKAIGTLDDYKKYINKYTSAFVALGDYSLRKKWLNIFANEQIEIVSIISPKSYISKSATIEKGTVIEPGCIVNTESYVGYGCILGIGCLVDHNCTIEDGVYLKSGVVIEPSTTIKSGSVISLCEGISK
ncbi:MAG: hypothetical protein ACI4FZ_08330 [Lachnospiraceae bacterium]